MSDEADQDFEDQFGLIDCRLIHSFIRVGVPVSTGTAAPQTYVPSQLLSSATMISSDEEC